MKWIHQLWMVGILVCAIGLCGQLSLAIADARANPAPAWSMPVFWGWIISPAIAWMLAAFFARKKVEPSAVLFVGTTMSSLGGWWLIWRDSTARHSPGGMNPFAPGPGILMSLTVYPFFHWILFLGFLLLCIPFRNHVQRIQFDLQGDRKD